MYVSIYSQVCVSLLLHSFTDFHAFITQRARREKKTIHVCICKWPDVKGIIKSPPFPFLLWQPTSQRRKGGEGHRWGRNRTVSGDKGLTRDQEIEVTLVNFDLNPNKISRWIETFVELWDDLWSLVFFLFSVSLFLTVHTINYHVFLLSWKYFCPFL